MTIEYYSKKFYMYKMLQLKSINKFFQYFQDNYIFLSIKKKFQNFFYKCISSFIKEFQKSLNFHI